MTAMLSAEQEYNKLTTNLPYKAKIIYKIGLFWTILHYIVMIVTFGANKQFRNYITTIGPWIGSPADWKGQQITNYVDMLAIIKHELRHVRQFNIAGLYISPIVGIIPGFIAYAFLPLPIGFAWFRWLMERDGYSESIRVYKYFYGTEGMNEAIDQATAELTGGAYGWTMPFKKYVKNWFTIKALKTEGL